MMDTAHQEYYYLAAEEGFLLYRDYYQGDKTADIELMQKLYEANPLSFVPIYQNFSVVKKDGYA